MIILVGGLPGSGKTYFAKRLAEKIDAFYLSSDKVRKTLGNSGKYKMDDKLQVYYKLVEFAKSRLNDSKNTVIVDATFSNETMRSVFVELADDIHVPLRFIWIYADEQLIKKRTQKPREDSDADFNVYEKIRNELSPITLKHLTLESTNENIDSMLKRATDYIFEHAGK